jgi:CRISPR-associated protein Cas2
MFIVVSYDISHDRRRARLSRELKNFGTRVQYSVFECVLEPQRPGPSPSRDQAHYQAG